MQTDNTRMIEPLSSIRNLYVYFVPIFFCFIKCIEDFDLEEQGIIMKLVSEEFLEKIQRIRKKMSYILDLIFSILFHRFA